MPTGWGGIVSVAASVLFAAISLLGGHLDGFSPEESTAWRVIFVLFALLAATFAFGGRAQLVTDVRKILRSPLLIGILLVTTVIMWLQLWVFMWAPANGHAQDVAMGYFLLPLVMVLVGRFVFRDRLTRWQVAAVVAAAVGVAMQLIIAQQVAWPALLVAGLYPVYFGLRRWWRIDSLQVFLLEITLLTPPAIILIVQRYTTSLPPFPASTGLLVVMAVLSAVAMVMYILASKWLTLGLFGLLSYLEPVLLLGVALLLGEAFRSTDALVYGPIGVALVLLGIGIYRDRRRGGGVVPEPPV